MTTPSFAVHHGSCLCGAVSYSVQGALRDVVGCHCTQCRKTTGHFMAASGCLKSDLKLLKEEGLKWYQSSKISRRGFCEECGATLFWDNQEEPHVAIAAGTLDGITGLNIVAHIFVENKGDYYQLDTNVPTFDASSNGAYTRTLSKTQHKRTTQ